MKMFVLWTVEELEAAIRDIEAGLASGLMSIAYNQGGQVSYISQEQAKKTLRSLYSAWRERRGFSADPSMKPKIYRVVINKGY